MRGSVRHHRRIAVDAERAWAVVGRPELLHHWFPGIAACEVVGARRSVTLGTGIRLDETILTNDALQRRFQYRIDGGLFKEHLATIDVLAIDAGSCIVSYASDADPATMAVVLGGAMHGALEDLARQLETDAGPALDALAATTAKGRT